MTAVLTEPAVRRRYANAFRPHPVVYWTDLLLSVILGWTAFTVSVWAPFGSLVQLSVTGVATLSLLRAVLFIHELAHRKRGTLPGFETAWNVVVGFPFMVPSLMYVGSHGDHHRQAVFATLEDPEYAPIARWPRIRIAGFLAVTLILPPLLALRWGVCGPLSWLVPSLRRRLIARASTLVINPVYRRPAPQGRQATTWMMQEIAVALSFWVIVGSVVSGWLPVQWLVQWYLVGTGMLLINQFRTLAAHRYDNAGERLDAVGQLRASINLRSRSLPTLLAAPLGLRYHALHHFLPTVPYHNLGALHRRLLAELPGDSLYRETERDSIGATVRDLFRPAEQADRASLPTAERVGAKV